MKQIKANEAGDFIVRKAETVVTDVVVAAANMTAAKAIAETGGGTFFREIQRTLTAEVAAKVTPV